MKSTIRRFFFILIGGCLISLSSGCASIFSKSIYPVKFETAQPDEEIAIINDEGVEVFRGKTPAVVKLKAASAFSLSSYQILRYKDGQVVSSTTINATLDPWVFGNFGALGVVASFLFSNGVGILVGLAVLPVGLLVSIVSGIVDGATGSMGKLVDSVSVD